MKNKYIAALWGLVLSAVIVTASTVAIAQGHRAGPSRGAIAQGMTDVVLRTDYRFNGYVTPFALALERGHYKAAGLNVTIEQGQGSAELTLLPALFATAGKPTARYKPLSD